MSKAQKSNQSKEATGMKIKKENAFAKAGDIIGAGVDALFGNTGSQLSMIPLDMIEVTRQIRETFEDEENTLHDLAESIKARGVLTPLLLRPQGNGYQLVAGERRFKASILAGIEQVPAFVREMTDEEAEDAQLAENIHRKNLTQIEEARKIQRDLDRLSKNMDRQASIDAILKKHHKSRAWLSKVLGLLKLPEQAKRVVTENLSADVEVINMVKTIELADPVQAEEVVNTLKEFRGKVNARDLVASVKDQVKPHKKPQEPEKETMRQLPPEQGARRGEKGGLGTAKVAEVAAIPLAHKLNDAYLDIVEHGSNPKTVLFEMSPTDRKGAENWLHEIYEKGKKEKYLGRAVIQGFRTGWFSEDGAASFALVAFLQGSAGAKFSLPDIFSGVA